jgi:uncharacterized OsmC-like protein
VKGVESRYEGDIDLSGFQGPWEDVPTVDYQNMPVYFKINTHISDKEKEELVKMVQKASSVFNTITKSVPVTVQLNKS